ncbi:MAG: aminoacyl-tRNA hydrolase [Myxococcales bacterium]|nr:aminoacyl-tRNA hydrolase [Myxococcales bacterium]
MAREDLRVRRGVVIPEAELRETASRASGPGGQHVNKTSTRVTLRWNAVRSNALSDTQRARVLERLATRITRGGDLVIHAERYRSQSRNRALARTLLADLVSDALRVARRRVATKPSRASRERSLEAKKRRSKVKKTRAAPRDSD